MQVLTELDFRVNICLSETDFQLAFKGRQQQVVGIISEDSDLISHLFGLDCPLIYKIDTRTGVFEYLTGKRVKEIPEFSRWSNDRFLMFSILSGCDYFKIPGIGPKKAAKLIQKYSDIDEVSCCTPVICINITCTLV